MLINFQGCTELTQSIQNTIHYFFSSSGGALCLLTSIIETENTLRAVWMESIIKTSNSKQTITQIPPKYLI